MSKVTPTSARKADHIRINVEEDVRSGLTTGLERVRLRHNAVPELDLNQVDTSLSLFGRQLRYPVLISSMTGGTQAAGRINMILAEVAQVKGLAMGLGSVRAALEDPHAEDSFKVRNSAPDVLLLANLGAVQLNYGYGLDECRRAVSIVEADALILHFNALQEALQPEGDVDFSHLLSKIEQVCRGLEVPVVAKEVGWGISSEAARRLVDVGVAAIDVAGAGGTSWSQVEMHRAPDSRRARLAGAFVDWGIPTATALIDVRRELPETPVFASGGLRDGIDIAKCLALGADLCGMAGPFLRAAADSPEAVVSAVELIADEIRISMFATGSRDLKALREDKAQVDL
jgi:isopentenyl-diphosphate delta-isomerase